jgi:starch synthase
VDLDMRGEVDREGVAQAMQRAAVVAIPSIGRESLGLVAIEAMAAGAIVVASRLGGLEETVLGGVTGLIVSPGDVPALASAIHRAGEIGEDPVAGAAMRAAGRAMAATHDRLRSATDSVALYDNLRR